MLLPDTDVEVLLNSYTFDLEDKDALAERLRAETDLRVYSDVVAYSGVAGAPPPPDVMLAILQTLFPIADIYANVLSSAIWEQVKAAFARRGKDESAVTVVMVETDDNGNVVKEMRGEIRDPEAIRELIRQFGKDQQ